MYFTAGPSLRNHAPSAVVRIGLDGVLLEGDLPPIQGAVVAMHTAMYADHADVGCVLHTHSPFATPTPWPTVQSDVWVEALAMFGLPSGVPVASYGPRGSEQAVANIRAAITPGVPAVLLANHGVLVFHRTPELAIQNWRNRGRAAQAGLNSSGLGGSVEIQRNSVRRPSSAPCSSSNMERRTPSELAPLILARYFWGQDCQK